MLAQISVRSAFMCLINLTGTVPIFLRFRRKYYIIAVKFKNPDKIAEFINGMILFHFLNEFIR
jgi:hypothetical protein